jgi:RNA polymerase sigma-70 factor (ECF subfamily)
MNTTFEAAHMVDSFRGEYEGPVRQASPVEGALVQQLKAGSEGALRELVQRYQSKVCRVTFGIVGNHQDAEEIAQHVFASIYFSINTFDGRSPFYTWVHRIAVNECYAFLRKKRPKAAPECDSAAVGQRTDGAFAFDPVVLKRDRINKLLESIPEDDRQLLLLREMEGYSVPDLAQATGLDTKTIRLRLFRTRQRLARATA